MNDLHQRFDALKKSLGGGPMARTLSGQLLLLTVLFVMLAEVLIYVPSIANFRDTWLKERLAAAQIASLSLEATMGDRVMPDLESELLRNAGALQISLQRNERRILMLGTDNIPMADASFDLRDTSPMILIRDAFVALLNGDDRVILVKGEPGFGGGELIEILIDERDLRDAMLIFSRNILTLSIIISILTAVLIFISLRTIFVKPMNNLARNIVEFREKPEDPHLTIAPQSHVAEIRIAEEELASMQTELRNSLKQKTRLAALGQAVSKINHDLRNILASAQLVSDSLSSSDDPKVQRLAPKLVSSIDRAVDLATNTLKFGKAEEPAPRKTNLRLAKVIDDVGTHVGLPQDGRIKWVNAVENGTEVFADPDQLFRILLNLGRNSAQAIEAQKPVASEDKIEVRAQPSQIDGTSAIDIEVIDTGPGFPEKAREHLFEAFSGNARKGGTGLGLAIARELTLAHGGDIQLKTSDQNGTVFCITLPNQKGAVQP